MLSRSKSILHPCCRNLSSEAAAFEKAAGIARVNAQRAKVAALAARGRRFGRTRGDQA
jgi:hypothetical protein